MTSGQLAAAGLALAEAACLWLWLRLLGSGPAGPPLGGLPPLALPLHALAAVWTPGLLARWPLLAPARRGLALYVVTAAAIALSLGAAALVGHASGAGSALVAIGLVVLWWRGAGLAADRFAYPVVLAEWRRCAVAATLGLFLGSPTLSTAGGGVALAVLTVLGGGLVALASAWRQGLAGRPAPSGPWAGSVGGVVVAALLPALLAAALLGPAMAAVLAAMSRAAGNALLFVLTPLLYLISWVFVVVIGGLLGLLHLTPRHRAPPTVPPSGPPRPRPLPPHPADLGPWLPWVELALVAVVAVLAYYALRGVSHARRPEPTRLQAPQDEREALLSWGALWRGLLGRLGRWLCRRPGAPAAHHPPPDADAPASALAMREVYRRLLILGATWGVARQPTETPHEYLTRLGHQASRREGDAALITTPYVQARYGADPPDAQAVQRAQDALHRLRADDGSRPAPPPVPGPV